MKFTALALLLSTANAAGPALRATGKLGAAANYGPLMPSEQSSKASTDYYYYGSDDDAFEPPADAEKCTGAGACADATAEVGTRSCVGYKACTEATGASIGADSCRAEEACKQASAVIGNEACNHREACEEAAGSIGKGSCNGKEACDYADATIGNMSCNYEGACKDAKGSIGDLSCERITACKNTKSTSVIGVNSCSATNACRGNSGTIGHNSCNGYEACMGNTEGIPDNCPSLSEFNLGRCDGTGGTGMTLAEEQAAGNARWILRAMPWGGFTNSAEDPTINKNDPMFRMPRVSLSDASPLFANAIPFASDQESGRIFFYLNGYHDLPGATLTVSQGGVNPELFAISGCGTSPNSIVDIQEPQCTKLSVSGDAYHCGHGGRDKEECMSTGKAALFAVHPEMEEWDADKYMVHELFPREGGFWMINFYGGNSGSLFNVESFANVDEGYIIPHDIQGGYSYEVPPFAEEPLPEDPATRARWLSHNALYATVSTFDHNFEDGATFGNPRSVTDGQSLALSTGTPVFNCPDEDATALDLEVHGQQLALSFSEGQVFGRVAEDGTTCGGMCAEVIVYGTAEALEAGSAEYTQTLEDFKVTHPLANWIWQGGSHMSSRYYLITPTRVELRDSPDQAAQSIDVAEYLGVTFSGEDAEKVKAHKLVKNEGYVARAE